MILIHFRNNKPTKIKILSQPSKAFNFRPSKTPIKNKTNKKTTCNNKTRTKTNKTGKIQMISTKTNNNKKQKEYR